jgi:hypothetical protein
MGSSAVTVTKVPAVAGQLVAQGTPVVLVGPDADALGQVLAAVPEGAGAGLLCVMVGDPDDAQVWGAAEEMATELGGRSRQAAAGTSQPG